MVKFPFGAKRSEIDWKAEAERLGVEVARISEAFAYHKGESARKSARISELAGKIEALNAEVARLLETAGTDSKGSIKGFNTLLKLVGGMATTSYGFRPDGRRSSVIAEIQSDLDLIGVSMDADTIRKWLKESAKLLKSAEDRESKPK